MRTLPAFRLIAGILLLSAAGACAYPPIPAAPDSVSRRYGVNIQRTMQRLTSGQSVKICFFGQSICDDGQSWTHTIIDTLKARFPRATITSVNKAVAGESSDSLLKYVAPQLTGVNPDLVIFHDYANSADSYERLLQEIIKTIPTTCEMLVFNDHVHNADQTWHDLWSLQLLPALCVKYKLGFNDTRTMWKLYLQVNYGDSYKWRQTSDDGTHFNAEGQWLQCQLMKPYFKSTAFALTNPSRAAIPGRYATATQVSGSTYTVRGQAGPRTVLRCVNGCCIAKKEDVRKITVIR